MADRTPHRVTVATMDGAILAMEPFEGADDASEHVDVLLGDDSPLAGLTGHVTVTVEAMHHGQWVQVRKVLAALDRGE